MVELAGWMDLKPFVFDATKRKPENLEKGCQEKMRNLNSQYRDTGIKDKYGAKVFENDVLEWHSLYTGLVKWSKKKKEFIMYDYFNPKKKLIDIGFLHPCTFVRLGNANKVRAR